METHKHDHCCGIHTKKSWVIYIIAIIAGIACGISGISVFEQIGKYCSEIFIRIFKCLSMPIISLSVIVALSNNSDNKAMNKIWKQVLKYTVITTVIASIMTALLYIVINPSNIGMEFSQKDAVIPLKASYAKYILDLIPDNIISAFAQHKVLSVLLISIIIGISIRNMEDNSSKKSIRSFFDGMHSIFFIITKFVVKTLPIALFGFITISIKQIKDGSNLGGMWKYFLIIIVANLLQSLVVVPTLMWVKKINPLKLFKSVSSVLSVAFFAKSTSGAIPVGLHTIETKLGIKKEIGRFAFPLATTINANGCAIFIFATVIYIMQNYGIEINSYTIITWIVITSVVAIGNAGIPMGCFMISASLLSSLNIPMPIMGFILPIYSIIDMLESATNIWSDICITKIVDQENNLKAIKE